HPQRSVITRAVGTDPDVDVDAFTIEADEGDVFLLCSDGLTDMVSDDDILHVVERDRTDLDRVTKMLVSAPNRAAGEDNITVVAFAIAAGVEDTVRMPAQHAEEDTLEGIPAPQVDTLVIPAAKVEEAFLEPGSAEAAAALAPPQLSRTARLRLVLAM